MNANSIGSVTPVRNAVRAAEIMMPPVTLRWPGRAVRQIASAAAGSANMKMGKNPVMNAPASGSPAKKLLMSPPSKISQTGTLSSWCSPIGMSSRLSIP